MPKRRLRNKLDMPKEQRKIARVIEEYDRGKLRSVGKRVTNRKQAIAIALSEARRLSKRH